MESKHTKGFLSTLPTDQKKQWVNIINSEKGIVIRTFYGDVQPIVTREEAEANAEFIAEAFNVANETGKTPRQLAEENRELLAVMEMIKSNNLQFGFDSSKRRILRLEKEEWDLMEQVIKKASK